MSWKSFAVSDRCVRLTVARGELRWIRLTSINLGSRLNHLLRIRVFRWSKPKTQKFSLCPHFHRITTWFRLYSFYLLFCPPFNRRLNSILGIVSFPSPPTGRIKVLLFIFPGFVVRLPHLHWKSSVDKNALFGCHQAVQSLWWRDSEGGRDYKATIEKRCEWAALLNRSSWSLRTSQEKSEKISIKELTGCLSLWHNVLISFWSDFALWWMNVVTFFRKFGRKVYKNINICSYAVLEFR